MITIELDDAGVRAALGRLTGRLDDASPAMAEIAEVLLESTRGRFRTGTDPEGAPWAPRSPATLAAYARARPPKRPGEKPLTLEGLLRGPSLAPFSGPREAGVGSSAIYAAVHQFGAARGAFGTTARGAPIPWGDIPARPFLGLSPADRAAVLDIVAEWLDGAVSGDGAQSP